MDSLIRLITKLDIPVISVVRSYCFGAGLILALNSDIIFASENALFCIPASKLNIKIPRKQILSLKKKLNLNFFKDLILSSRKFTADEAYSNNIINACVKEKDLENFSKKYINNIVDMDRSIITFYVKLLKN